MQTDEIAIQTGPELSAQEVAEIVAGQNDAFRKSIFGQATDMNVPPGRVVMTSGVGAMSAQFQAELIATVTGFEAFDTDCDPHGWHEMGAVEIDGEKVWFKIDLYDEAYEYGSSDPTDPEFTRRVLTLLFPSEY